MAEVAKRLKKAVMVEKTCARPREYVSDNDVKAT